MKTAVGSEMSLVSGTYHENFGSVVMEMASFCLKIRHVFGFTSLTERSIGAGPPVIIQLSVPNPLLQSFHLPGNFLPKGNIGLWQQLGNLLSLCREIAGARDILQKFENLKKQHEWNFNL